jgi:hypothetical protein
VTTPVVVLVLTVGVPATGAELDGAIVAVTLTAFVPPCPSATVMLNVSVLVVVEIRAEARAVAVGV